MRSLRKRLPAQRHELVVSLVCIHASREKRFGRDALFLGDEVGVVIVKLVIVPRDEPRKQSMRVLQRHVQPVLRIPRAVLVEAYNLIADVFPRPLVDALVLVDVVAKVHDQVEVLFLHMG